MYLPTPPSTFIPMLTLLCLSGDWQCNEKDNMSKLHKKKKSFLGLWAGGGKIFVIK